MERAWREKSFPYGLLLNLATNELLPHRLRAAVMDFVRALYVDRFPQIPKSGAPCLPEKLFVFHEDAYEGQRKSNNRTSSDIQVEMPWAYTNRQMRMHDNGRARAKGATTSH